MLTALNYVELEQKVRKKYINENQRVMGIVLAYYDDGLVRDLVDDFYMRWNRFTGYDFDMFWAGYGKAYSPYQGDGIKILEFDDNKDYIFFDSNKFYDIEKRIYANLAETYQGNPQIILLECQNGKMIYDNYYIIDLEFDMKNDTFNYRMTNRLIHEITNVCRNSHNLEDVIRLFEEDEWKKYVKIVGKVVQFMVKGVQATIESNIN